MNLNITPIKDSHCSFCGTKFTQQNTYPRRCFICWHDTYHNPIPVVVAIIRVFQRDSGAQCGWLVQKRAQAPGKGGWAFPGGYVEFGETYQQACAREIKEEIGLDTKPDHYHVEDILNDSQGHMMIFCYHTEGIYQDEIHFTPNNEVLEIDFPILPEHRELVFATHNHMWRRVYDYESI